MDSNAGSSIKKYDSNSSSDDDDIKFHKNSKNSTEFLNKSHNVSINHPTDYDVIDINEVSAHEHSRVRTVRLQLDNILNNISYKYICELRSTLPLLTEEEIKNLESILLNVLGYLKEFIEKNRESSNYYTIFQSTKELLLSIINKENKLLELLNIREEFLRNQVDYLEGMMKSIIDKQIKMKKSRKNLKNKMRLQRRLNEVRDKVKELTNNSEEENY